MQLRPFAYALCSLALVPACSAIVSPDTTRLGPAGNDAGMGMLDVGGNDVGPPPGDGGVSCATGCDDGIACTIDTCVTGVCHHMPSGAMCSAGMHCSVTDGCVPNGPMMCMSDAACSDGNACNGMETCHPGAAGANANGCVAGTPLDCNDGFACTADSCAPSGCVHTPSDALCNAGCFTGATCQVGVGCTGGASMMCVPDGNGCTADPPTCDAASGMCLHPPRDEDRDGYPAAFVNGMACTGGTDCNDANANVHPGATEICNGIDDNCNGQVDEGGVCGMPGPDSCATEQAIALTHGGTMWTGAASGTTVGDTDNYRSMCSDASGGAAPPNGAADAVYYIDVPFTGGLAADVTISTNNPGTNYDSVVAGVVGVCNAPGFASASTGGVMARCNDDVSTSNHTSSVTLCVPGSATGSARLHILVDGYMRGAEGTYNVTVTVTPRVTPCP